MVRGLDENTTEKPNHASCMEQLVWFIGRHNIFDASDKIITPCPVLSAHVLLLKGVFLLITLEQIFCICQLGKVTLDLKYGLAVSFLSSRSTSS